MSTSSLQTKSANQCFLEVILHPDAMWKSSNRTSNFDAYDLFGNSWQPWKLAQTYLRLYALHDMQRMRAALGKSNVVMEANHRIRGFLVLCRAGNSGLLFRLGGADPEKFTQAKAGTILRSNHSPLFAPDVDPALHTGIAAEVAVLRDLL